jgi:hypothetical protein
MSISRRVCSKQASIALEATMLPQEDFTKLPPKPSSSNR